MFKCTEPSCKKEFKREQDVKMHWQKVHSVKVPFKISKNGKKRGRPRKNILTLADAVVALKVKRDSFDEVISLLEGLGR